MSIRNNSFFKFQSASSGFLLKSKKLTNKKLSFDDRTRVQHHYYLRCCRFHHEVYHHYDYYGFRLFSSSSSSSSSSLKKTKVKHRKKSLNDTTTKMTSFASIKDKIRQINEKNMIESRNIMMTNNNKTKNEINHLLERAYDRVSYARTQLYQYWNPDYQSSSDLQQQKRLLRTNNRPIKQGLIMDGRWWKWNLLLALFPATFIGLYCHFIGEPAMKRFREDQEIQQMIHSMGPEFVEQYQKQMDEQNQQQQSSSTTSIVVSIEERIRKVIQELSYLMEMYFGEKQEEEKDTDNSDNTGSSSNNNNNDHKNSAVKYVGGINKETIEQDDHAIIKTATSKDTSELSSNNNSMKKLEAQSSTVQPSRKYDNHHTSSTTAHGNNDTTIQIQELLYRIEQLEQIIHNQKQQQGHRNNLHDPIRPTETLHHQQQEEENQALLQRQIERSKQSGIQNRVHDNLSYQWKKQLEELQNQNNNNNNMRQDYPVSTTDDSWQEIIIRKINRIISFVSSATTNENSSEAEEVRETKNNNNNNKTIKKNEFSSSLESKRIVNDEVIDSNHSTFSTTRNHVPDSTLPSSEFINTIEEKTSSSLSLVERMGKNDERFNKNDPFIDNQQQQLVVTSDQSSQHNSSTKESITLSKPWYRKLFG